MLQHPSQDNFIEIPRDCLPEIIAYTDTSSNQKKYQALPKKRAPIILNNDLAKRLKDFNGIDIKAEKYHSDKITNRQRWDKFFTDKKYNNNTKK